MVRSWVHSAAFLRQRCPMWEGLRSTKSAQRLLEETRVTVISHKIILLNATVRHRLWTAMYFDERLAISDTAWGSTSICRCKEYGIKSYWISYSFSFHASIVDNSIKDCIVICTCRFKLDPFTGNHAAFTHFAQIGGFGLLQYVRAYICSYKSVTRRTCWAPARTLLWRSHAELEPRESPHPAGGDEGALFCFPMLGESLIFFQSVQSTVRVFCLLRSWKLIPRKPGFSGKSLGSSCCLGFNRGKLRMFGM